MLHIVHLIQRRRAGRPLGVALPLIAASAALLLGGLGLLLMR